MMQIEVRHLKLVDAIAGEGTMTKAASRLYVTQSALSHSLREAEARLGTPLFHRLKRKMVLTEAGNRLLRTAQSVLKQLQELENEIGRMSAGIEATLRISTQCNTGYSWLPPVIQLLHQKHPGIDIHIHAEATSDPLKALLEGQLDIAIISSAPKDFRLQLYPLFEDEMVAVMRTDHKLAVKSYLTGRDFLKENLIVYATPRETSMIFQKLLIPEGITPHKVTPIMLTEAMIEMARAGLGISIVTGWVASPHVKDGHLKAVRITAKGLRRKWFAAMIRSAAVPAYYTEFIRLIATNSIPAVVRSKQQKHKT